MQNSDKMSFVKAEASDSYVTPQIGDVAPYFHGVTTKGEISFPDDFKGKWVVFFSHAGDFLPVSTTEYMQFAANYQRFLDINTELVGISMDSIYTHIAWIRRIRELSWRGIKFADVAFPIVEDVSMEISLRYGMIKQIDCKKLFDSKVYIIDCDSKINAVFSYPESVGRNIEEIYRVLTALQKIKEEDVFTPANWKKGEDVILKTPNDVTTINKRISEYEKKRYCLDWFMCFRQEEK